MHAALAALVLLRAIQAAGPTVPLGTVPQAQRVRDDSHRLIMFNTTPDSSSAFVLVQRSVARTSLNGRAALQVREENRARGSLVTVHLDATSLRPLAYEARNGDTLSTTATVAGDSLTLTEVRRGVITTSTAPLPRDVYWSNSFSELLQANNFNSHPSVRFKTLTPGGSINSFVVERVGRRTFDHGVKVLVLRFTRIDAAGATTPGGFRYVDATSGKVLFFTTELDSPTGFSYQVLPLR